MGKKSTIAILLIAAVIFPLAVSDILKSFKYTIFLLYHHILDKYTRYAYSTVQYINIFIVDSARSTSVWCLNERKEISHKAITPYCCCH